MILNQCQSSLITERLFGQKLKQNKSRFSRDPIKKYKSHPRNLPFLRVTPQIGSFVKQKSYYYYFKEKTVKVAL